LPIASLCAYFPNFSAHFIGFPNYQDNAFAALSHLIL